MLRWGLSVLTGAVLKHRAPAWVASPVAGETAIGLTLGFVGPVPAPRASTAFDWRVAAFDVPLSIVLVLLLGGAMRWLWP
jgi:hypothetical protein